MQADYEDKVIAAAKKGLAEGFTVMTKEMENLLRLVYRAGYKQSTIDALEKQIQSQQEKGWLSDERTNQRTC